MTSPALITPKDLATMMQSEPVVIIDTRDPGAFAEGHIPGAANLRDIFTYLATTDPEGLSELKEKFAELFGSVGISGTETVVFYEDSMNTGFGQSCRGYFLLKSLGYEKTSVLHGGLEAWKAEGMSLSTEEPVLTPASFPVTAEPTSSIVTKDEMLVALDNPGIVMLDVRDRDEWEGISSSPYGIDFCPRKGRIPGAVWIEWYKLMDEPEGGIAQFRSPEEILAACKEVGITPETTVYLYCFKGARASNTFVALHEAGIEDVKIYFGSWNEWSRDPALPIDDAKLAAA